MLNCKTYKEVNPQYSALQQFLYNRGIDIEDQDKWLNADWEDMYDWTKLDAGNIIKACNLVADAITYNDNVMLVVDADTDGWTSSAILYNFLWEYYPDWVDEHLFYIHHKGKQHGLEDVYEEILEGDYKLVITPDGASNDIKQHEILNDVGIDVIVLDHHEVDLEIRQASPALIINVQACSYPNKALTGAGVVYKFICAYAATILDIEEPKHYIDLCALGNCGDMASLRELEIRAITKVGFSEDRLSNPFLYTLSQKNKYSIDKMNGVNYYSMAFYVVPFINSLTRSGTMEEKDLVFKSFLLKYAFEKVESSKRGHKGEEVRLVDEAVLVAERVKRRQTKLQDESMVLLEQKIQDEDLLDNALLLFLCEPGQVEKNLQGLIANKLQAKYQRPTAVLTYSKTKDDKEVFYRGSARNYSLSEIHNLKDMLQATDKTEYAAGHQGAFGLSIAEADLEDFIDAVNKAYENINMTPTYWVDYIWNENTMDPGKILDIAEFTYYGQEMPESLVCVKDIQLRPDMVTLMGVEKGHPTLKIMVNGVAMIKFKSSEEEYERFCEPGMLLTVTAKANKNEWAGNISPQLLIEDFELREEFIF